MMTNRVARALIAPLFGLASVAASMAAPPVIAPIGGPWDAGAGFSFPGKTPKDAAKQRRALSGVACLPGEPPLHCLAVFDEGGEARFMKIARAGYVVDDDRVVLKPGDLELDAEAAATDGHYYYVAGSHSAKRGDCANNPDSRNVFRFAAGPTLGSTSHPLNGAPSGLQVTNRLWAAMTTMNGLSGFVGDRMCLGRTPPKDAPQLAGKNGINIEGIAIREGKLHFGFRGPSLDGQIYVLSVDADSLFTNAEMHPILSTFMVEKGLAIRDLVTVSDGVLLLLGPDDDPEHENLAWKIARWDGQGAQAGKIVPLSMLAVLDLHAVSLRKCDKELKPEGLAILEDNSTKPYSVLIFSDGMCDGGPLKFEVPRE